MSEQDLLAFRAELEQEISYSHWSMDFRDGLKKALKWFDKRFPAVKSDISPVGVSLSRRDP